MRKPTVITVTLSLFLLAAGAAVSFAQPAPTTKAGPLVPGETRGSASLQRDTLQLLFIIDGAADSACRDRKIGDTKLLETLKQPKSVGGRMVQGSWRERWDLNRCGKLIEYDVIYTADGKGGTNINTAPVAKIGSAQKRAATAPDTVILKADTAVPVELVENLNGEFNKVGKSVSLRVTEAIYVGGEIAIQQGARVQARIVSLKQRAEVGRSGDLTLQPVALIAADGQWVDLDKDRFGAQARQRTGKAVGAIVAFGIFGLLAKGDAATVLRGTRYEVVIRRDTAVNTAAVQPLPTLTQAALQLTADFKKVKKIKFSRGKQGKNIVLEITVTPITDELPELAALPKIVQILDYILLSPIRAIDVKLNDKRKVLKATFDWWSIIKYCQPGGDTSMIVQITLPDGRVAEARPVLETNWKLSKN